MRNIFGTFDDSKRLQESHNKALKILEPIMDLNMLSLKDDPQFD